MARGSGTSSSPTSSARACSCTCSTSRPSCAGDASADAASNHATIERELAATTQRLARLPRVLALSKADLVTAERAREAVAEWDSGSGRTCR